jgi:hypothetical protein
VPFHSLRPSYPPRSLPSQEGKPITEQDIWEGAQVRRAAFNLAQSCSVLMALSFCHVQTGHAVMKFGAKGKKVRLVAIGVAASLLARLLPCAILRDCCPLGHRNSVLPSLLICFMSRSQEAGSEYGYVFEDQIDFVQQELIAVSAFVLILLLLLPAFAKLNPRVLLSFVLQGREPEKELHTEAIDTKDSKNAVCLNLFRCCLLNCGPVFSSSSPPRFICYPDHPKAAEESADLPLPGR